MKPTRHTATDASLAALLELLRDSFAYMDARVDPPSSIHRLDAGALAAQCDSGEVWSLGDPPLACVFLVPMPGRLYLGKLAVAAAHRRRGHAATLVRLAERRARAHGLERIELKSRIELVENHRAFERLGFTRSGEGSHPGFDRPTHIVMSKPVRA